MAELSLHIWQYLSFDLGKGKKRWSSNFSTNGSMHQQDMLKLNGEVLEVERSANTQDYKKKRPVMKDF